MKQTILLLLGLLHLVLSRPEGSFSGPGSYSFSYDTNTGGFHSQSGSAKGAAAKYGFNTGEGNLNVQFSGGGGNGGAPLSSYKAPSGNGGGGGSYTLNLNPDGSYAYSYDLNDQAKSENRGTDGEVAGKFSYTDPEGQKKAIQYTAGIAGFLPTGDHIPKPDPLSAAPAGYPSSYSGLGNGGDSGTLELNLQPGGDYSYSYNLKDQAKSESGSGGKVRGQFSFTAPDGKNRAIKYTADEGGFQAEGDHIPKPVEPLPVPSASASSYSGIGNGGDSGTLALNLQPGGDYSYSYNLKDQAKSEIGSGGKVRGQFSFTAPDGKNRAIKYKADEGGFQAEGDHIPKPVEPLPVPSASGYFAPAPSPSNGSPGSYSYNYDASEHAKSESGSGGTVSGHYSVSGPGNSQSVKYTANGGYNPIVEARASLGNGGGGSSYSSGLNSGAGGAGGSYSFNYAAQAHDRAEQGSSGDISGKYNVKSKGGDQKSSYTAGKQGFSPIHKITINLG